MTEQEDYDRRRKAKYARERKATEEALRPRMVKRGGWRDDGRLARPLGRTVTVGPEVELRGLAEVEAILAGAMPGASVFDADNNPK